MISNAKIRSVNLACSFVTINYTKTTYDQITCYVILHAELCESPYPNSNKQLSINDTGHTVSVW